MRTPAAVLEAADYLILHALDKRPLNTKEVSQALQMSRVTATKKLKSFAEKGLIVKRHPDQKWVPKMVMWVAPVQDVADVTAGRPVNCTPNDKQKPDVSPPEEPPKPYTPPRNRTKASEKAEAAATRFHIPPVVEGRGELTVGQVDLCIMCKQKTTPFRYGGKNICPRCARGGR